MGRLLAVAVVAAALSAACAQDCQAFCTMEYMPVCGSNGQLYKNECELEVGRCQCDNCFTLVPSCVTTCVGDAVGTAVPCSVQDNDTCALTTCTQFHGPLGGDIDSEFVYDNGGEEGDDGDVLAAFCARMCTNVYQPVCGSDGVTYANECRLEEEQCRVGPSLTVVSDGECPATAQTEAPISVHCDMLCSTVYDPVCASDLNTYMNECAMENAICEGATGLFKLYDGECPSSANPTPVLSSWYCANTQCTAEAAEICGSDGQTYLNECVLEYVRRCNRGTATKAYDGRCTVLPAVSVMPVEQKETPCPTDCPMTESYVCASDGQSYINSCVMLQEACRAGVTLQVVSSGWCVEAPIPSTTRIPVVPIVADPTPTTVHLEIVLSEFPTITAPTATATDCPRTCPLLYSPVCGSDGRTYSNACMLAVASCHSPVDVSFVSSGECNTTAEVSYVVPTQTQTAWTDEQLPLETAVPPTPTKTPTYVRCRNAGYCAFLLGGTASNWRCATMIRCRPLSCDMQSNWRTYNCSARLCGVDQDGTLTEDSTALGYCRLR